MASNYWASSQCKNWLFTKDELASIRGGDDKSSTRQANFLYVIQSVGKQMRFDQIVVATATTYFRRFFLRSSESEFDPRIVSATTLYLAAKVEELGPINCNDVIRAFREFSNVKGKWSAAQREDFFKDLSPLELFAMERHVVKRLDFDLVVFHPYSELDRFLTHFAKCTPAFTMIFKEEESVLNLAWKICNDSQRSDLSFLYPPFVIALACLFLSLSVNNINAEAWMETLNVNQNEVKDCVEALVLKRMEDIKKKKPRTQQQQVLSQ